MKISVVIPTRGRPEQLWQAVTSLVEAARDPARIDVLIGVDDDDAATVRAFAVGYEFTDWSTTICGAPTRFIAAPRPDTLGAVTNNLAAKATGDIIMAFPDDFKISQGWDEALIHASNWAGDSPAAFYPNDPTHPDFPSIFAVNRAWLETVGFLCAPWFPYWFADTWIYEVGFLSRRLIQFHATVGDFASRGETIGLRDIAFWAQFFEAMRPFRERQAMEIAKRSGSYGSEAERALAFNTHRGELTHASEWLAAQAPRFETHYGAETGPPSDRYLRAKKAAQEFLETVA